MGKGEQESEIHNASTTTDSSASSSTSTTPTEIYTKKSSSVTNEDTEETKGLQGRVAGCTPPEGMPTDTTKVLKGHMNVFGRR